MLHLIQVGDSFIQLHIGTRYSSITVFVFLNLLFQSGTCYPRGAPTIACRSMFPSGHGVDPQISNPPFVVSVDKTTYDAGERISVTLSGTDELRGLLLQVKRPGTAIPLGSWEDIPDFLQPLECEGSETSITHRNNTVKNLPFSSTWVSPNKVVGYVQVFATIVKTREILWTGIVSETIMQSSVNTTLTTSTPIRSTGMPPSPSTDSFLPLVIVIGVTVVIVVVCAAVIIKTMLKKRRSKTKRKEQSQYFESQFAHRSMAQEEQSRRDAVDPEFKAVEIFDYDNIKEGTLLGSGQYGEVFKGEAILQGKTTWTVVAIKKPKNAISQEVIDDFKNEIRLMLELGKHPNIVPVLGCCTVGEPFYLLTDFMEYGDLLHFLRKCCKEGNTELDPIYKTTTINQLQIAQQIANGMTYVSHTRFFHGDLAARNILVGAGLVVKITDFGLTDDLYQKGYTRLQADAKRPYKWYSPESIERQFCTLKTDIWSFGVLMWEILTFGQQTPYRGMSIREVLFRLKDGYRMPCPEGTPAFMEKMINSCWQLDPEDRPSFGDLLEATNFLLERGTGDGNYITAEDDEVEPEANTENVNSPTRKKSLIQLLNFENIDPSEISRSSESALSGVSRVSSGCASMQLNTITEDESPAEETV